MAEVASAFVSLMPSARGFGKEAESQVSGEMKKSGSRVGKFFSGALKKTAVGAMAAVGATAGVALFKGFGRLKGIEEAQAKLTGLGHSAKSVDKIMNSALASVKGTAFGLDEAATVAASAVAAGVEPGKALQRTLTLVGDAATIAGTDMGSMGAIFNKVAASNKLQMDSVNQLHDAGIPALQLVAKQLGVTAEEASKMASEGKVDFATFQKAMQKGLGGAAQESGKTFSGSLANMQAALGRLGANVLQGVFGKMPALFTKVGTSLDKLGPLATRAGELLGDGMTRAGKAVAPLAQQLGGSLRRAAAQATAVIKGIDWSPLVRIGESVRRDLIPALISFGKVVAKNVGAALKAVAPR
ncbi:tape measure protein [Nocardioides alcanivorans]|uniref:tape measure protein n=1 Tax=Nocardioides alcanivorans TaxID=2897352 RepID=UPI001F406616|nr:tape measure protein [Nocardioides alcanivorans]